MLVAAAAFWVAIMKSKLLIVAAALAIFSPCSAGVGSYH
jgi:hypothetical protein